MASQPPRLRLAASDGIVAPEHFQGMTFDDWVEQNAERIWALMRAGSVRDRSFNDVAEQLWSQM